MINNNNVHLQLFHFWLNFTVQVLTDGSNNNLTFIIWSAHIKLRFLVQNLFITFHKHIKRIICSLDMTFPPFIHTILPLCSLLLMETITFVELSRSILLKVLLEKANNTSTVVDKQPRWMKVTLKNPTSRFLMKKCLYLKQDVQDLEGAHKQCSAEIESWDNGRLVSTQKACFMFPFLHLEMFPLAHIHKHTHGALLSAGHVQKDGIPELRETAQAGGGVGVGWRYGKYRMEPLHSLTRA